MRTKLSISFRPAIRHAALLLAGLLLSVGNSQATAAPDGLETSAEAELIAAWNHFQAGRFAQAESHYRKARELGDPRGDATLGLAWSLQRRGRCEEARFFFLALQKGDPLSTRADDGLRACPPPRPRIFLPQVTQGLYFYQNHPLRDLTSATLASLDVWLHERVLLGAGYRFSHFKSVAQNPAWQQHDLYLHAGYAERFVGITAHYALLHGALTSQVTTTGGNSDYAQTSHHIGVTARISPRGDGMFASAVSLYPDLSVLRGELSWRIPLPRGFVLRPAASLQIAQGPAQSSGEFNQAGALTASYEHPRFGVFLGGKYGTERRPVFLDYSVAYNGPERVSYGLLAGGVLRPGRGFLLSLGYAWDHLFREADSTASAINSEAHYLTFSLSKEL